MLISSLPTRRLGNADGSAPLRFGSGDPQSPTGPRYLLLEGEPAFELSMWCGTCPFLFERQTGANRTLSADLGAMAQLEQPLDDVDETILDTFSPLVPHGDYLPLLLEVLPNLTAPYDQDDYFTREQLATWQVDSFWGLPENPRSFYYRTFETAVDDEAHLYEFIVPMVPPPWNDRGRVEHYRDLIGRGTAPTAVALSTLETRLPADGPSADYYTHWLLSHFLLDGHHKVEAAAQAGRPIRLLALVSIDESLADPGAIGCLPDVLRRPRMARQVSDTT